MAGGDRNVNPTPPDPRGRNARWLNGEFVVDPNGQLQFAQTIPLADLSGFIQRGLLRAVVEDASTPVGQSLDRIMATRSANEMAEMAQSIRNNMTQAGLKDKIYLYHSDHSPTPTPPSSRIFTNGLGNKICTINTGSLTGYALDQFLLDELYAIADDPATSRIPHTEPLPGGFSGYKKLEANAGRTATALQAAWQNEFPGHDITVKPRYITATNEFEYGVRRVNPAVFDPKTGTFLEHSTGWVTQDRANGIIDSHLLGKSGLPPVPQATAVSVPPTSAEHQPASNAIDAETSPARTGNISGALRAATAGLNAAAFARSLVGYANGETSGAEVGLSAVPAALSGAEYAVVARGAGNVVAQRALAGASLIAGGALPYAQEWIKQGEFRENGDGYGLTIASTRGNYRAAAGVASAGAGFAAGSVVPTGYTSVAGGLVGLGSGIILDGEANRLANEAFAKDPELQAQAAKLQAELNRTVIAPKVGDILARADQMPHSVAAQHLENSIAKGGEQAVSFANQAEAAVREQAVKMNPEQLRGFAESYNEPFQKISWDISNSPITAEQESQARGILTEVGETRRFLQERKIPDNDPAAKAKLDEIMASLDEAEHRATLVVGSYTLDRRINSMSNVADRVIVENINTAIAAREQIITGNEEKVARGTQDANPALFAQQNHVMDQEINRLKSERAGPASNVQMLEQRDRRDRSTRQALPPPESASTTPAPGAPTLTPRVQELAKRLRDNAGISEITEDDTPAGEASPPLGARPAIAQGRGVTPPSAP